jgi:formylglycine-generating enzyme required for sulfatase activity
VKKTVDYETPILQEFVNMGSWASIPAVSTFVNDDGSVSVCAFDGTNKRTYIYEYNEELVEQKTLTFTNELDIFGAFTKDKDGNYYIFYAKSTNSKTENNMAMVKYDKNGKKTKTFYLVSDDPESFGGVKIPFAASTCRLEISGSILAVYFGRDMFAGNDGLSHQASYGFVLNKDTFKRLDAGTPITLDPNKIPFVSHSFDQFILPVDNGFIFADLGDANPRSFTFARFKYGEQTQALGTFRFPGTWGDNSLFSQLGGVAKTSTGYIFTGTTPNEPWDVDVYQKIKYHARNLLIITIKENFTASNPPVKITSFSNIDESSGATTYAAYPKIVDLGGGMYLLLWEEELVFWEKIVRVGFQGLFMQIIDETGEKLSDKIKIEGARIGKHDIPRYNSRNGFVYWSTNNNIRNEIHVIGLNTRNYTAGIRAVDTTKNYTIRNETYYGSQQLRKTLNRKVDSDAMESEPDWYKREMESALAAMPQRLTPVEMTRINGGVFTMGSPANEPGRNANEGPQRQVTLSSFYMGKFEITQKEWYEVMGTTVEQQRNKAGSRYSLPLYGEGDDYPMYYVSWLDAIDYCNKRSVKEGLTPPYTISGIARTDVTWNRSANGYRLPTEAEWEYVCRAGTTTAYNTGAAISDNTGWYKANSGDVSHPVGQKPANRWGLFDMHGNAQEWCWDWWSGAYSGGEQTNPAGESSGQNRMSRGGCWISSAEYVRSSYRNYSQPSDRTYTGAYTGFRLVRNYSRSTLNTEPTSKNNKKGTPPLRGEP